MKKLTLIKVFVLAALPALVLLAFSFSRTEPKTLAVPLDTPEKIASAAGEIAGYRNWTKVNEAPELIESRVERMCVRPTQEMIDKESKSPHLEKYINVFVNAVGKDEMLTKKNPQFPVGTVIVKEKLPSAESSAPELLTVMIKREKGFNPEVGDWEFLTFNGAGSETTARGRLANCQMCHVDYQRSDFVTRTYLPYELREKLK